MTKRKEEEKDRLKEHTLLLGAAGASAFLDGVKATLQHLSNTWNGGAEERKRQQQPELHSHGGEMVRRAMFLSPMGVHGALETELELLDHD